MSNNKKKRHPVLGALCVIFGVSMLGENLLSAILLLSLGWYLISPHGFVNTIRDIFTPRKRTLHDRPKNSPLKKETDLLKLQSLIFQFPQTELRMGEAEMRRMARNICQQKLKVLTDTANIVNTTKNPHVFFERYDLLYKTAEELVPYEEFIHFSGSSPTQLIEQFDEQRSAAIINLIDRAYSSTTEKAFAMKTERGRRNQFEKFFASFSLYDNELTDEAKQHLAFLQESVEASV